MLVVKKSLSNYKLKNKPAKYLFDYLMIILIGIYIIKENVLTISLKINKEYFPVSEQRIELLTGEKLLRDKFFNGGAYTVNLDEYNLGPIPYNYPSAIGWLLYGKGPFENISNYYITANILYFSAIITLLLSIIIIFKNFNKIYGYLYTFLILSSYIIYESSFYSSHIPNTINPGTVPIYAIAVSTIFIASLKNNKLIYIYLLIFFTGILLQNHMTSFIYTSTLLLYSLIVLFKTKKEKKNYILLSIALLPWVQILANITNILSRFEGKLDNISYNKSMIPLFEKDIYKILPFSNIFDMSKLNESSIQYLIYLLIYIIPLITYFLIKKEIKLSNYKAKLFTIISITTLFDTIFINSRVHEYQHRSYLVGQIFIFILFLIVFLIKKINENITKVVLITIFITLINYNMSLGINQSGNNKYLTKENIEKLKEKPIVFEYYDKYNNNRSIFLELIYEFLIYKIDFCVNKNEKKINYNYSFSDIGKYHKSLNYISSKYICNENQLLENRSKLYLIEDKARALPLYFSNAVMLTRISNNKISKIYRANIEDYPEDKNQKNCYMKNFVDKSIYNKDCKLTNNFHTYETTALYIQEKNIEKNLKDKIFDQKNIINNIIYANEEIFRNTRFCRNCIYNVVSLSKNDNFAVEVKELLNYYHDYLHSNNKDIIGSNNLIKENLEMLNNDFLEIEYLDEKSTTNNMVGEYITTYKTKHNNQRIYLINEIDENNFTIVDNKDFSCRYNVYNIDNKMKIETPICSINNYGTYNLTTKQKVKNKAEMENKIKYAELIKELYKILYKNRNIEDRVNIGTNAINPTYDESGIIKYIDIISIQKTLEDKNNLFYLFARTHELLKTENIYNNEIYSITAKIYYKNKLNDEKINNCIVDIFQPWYYMVPNYHYIQIQSCN